METSASIRPSVCAGPRRFYPSDKAQLTGMLREMFARAEVPATSAPMGIVSPHAGYAYSGPTAAHGYKLLRGHHYDRVIIVAPSHYAAFPGGSIFPGDAYETPLGLVPLDHEFCNRLSANPALFDFYPECETREHSLEVQLPFLQHVLGDFPLVPVMVCDQTHENCKAVATAITHAIHESTGTSLIVASSDLFHGPGHTRALAKSRAAADAIELFDVANFRAGIEGGDYMACGAGPIEIAMLVSKAAGATTATILDLTTSHDVAGGSEDYIVGYLSASFA